MKKQLFFILCFFAATQSHAQVFFSQNFDGATLGSIVSATPSSSQFNAVGASNGTGSPQVNAASIAITADKIQAEKTANGQGTGISYLAVTTDFAAATQFIVVKFDLEISGSGSGNSFLQFFLGSGFSADETIETDNAKYASRITFNGGAASGFKVRANAGSDAANFYSGNNTVRIFMNQTEESRAYVGPDASTGNILAKNTYNVWVGNVKQYTNNVTVTNAGNALTNFKFFMSGGPAVYKIDNIELTALDGTLPVSLSSFTGKLNGNATELKWTTQSEQNNSHFDILKSSDGKVFSKIGTVQGNGTTPSVNTYSFRDATPASGTNYYQLQQTDLNGIAQTIGQIAIKAEFNLDGFHFYADAENNLNAQVDLATSSKTNIRVVDLTGRLVIDKNFNLSSGSNSLKLSTSGLNKGIYVATIVTNGEAKSVKILL